MTAETALIEPLRAISPRSPAEASDVDRMCRVAGGATPWDRSMPLHLTGSALVVHPPTERVLLRWHERQQAWMQVGGHGDPGEVDPVEVALREAVEETGLEDLRPWPDADRAELVHAVIVPVPANDKEPAHEHGDLRFVLATEQPETATPENEAAALRWLTVDAATELTHEPNVRESLRRVGELFDRER
jgi:8-oxo-dGTP pyrophosphatase MutT (NUDIX family)